MPGRRGLLQPGRGLGQRRRDVRRVPGLVRRAPAPRRSASASRTDVIVEASAETDEDFLLRTLDIDEGARRLGEFGIGCNEGIDRAYGNALFDEKIYGTIHLAIGAGFPTLGGTNESAVHWDIVKELRNGGEIWLDGELVQKNGAWQF